MFTEAERAALALAEEGTRLADALALVNAANRLGVILRQLGGSYEPSMFAGMSS